MDYEMKLKQELYDKLEKEYNDFIEDLKTKTPDEIINKSYEKVMKEELKEMAKKLQILKDEATKKIINVNNTNFSKLEGKGK